MAHKKQRSGPKNTRNKERKSQRAAIQQERYRNHIADQKRREEEQRQATTKNVTVTKRRTYSMTLSAQARRIRVFDRLAAVQVQQVKDGLPLDPRVTQEMKVLNERFVGLMAA